jgi:hypothetical protein
LNSFIGTLSTPQAAPMIVAQRLRKGSCGSARGAARLVADADDDQVPESGVRRTIRTVDLPCRRRRDPVHRILSKRKSEQVPGRLVVRRIPDLNPKAVAEQPTLFDTWRFHAFVTTSGLDTVTADKTHRGHAIIERSTPI